MKRWREIIMNCQIQERKSFKNVARLLIEAEYVDELQYEGDKGNPLDYMAFLSKVNSMEIKLVDKIIEAYYQDTREYNTREQVNLLRWECRPETVDGLRPVTFIRNVLKGQFNRCMI